MKSSWKYAATLMLGAVLLAGAAFAGSAGADGKAAGAPKGAKGKKKGEVASPNPTVKPKIVDKNGKVVKATTYVVRVDGMM